MTNIGKESSFEDYSVYSSIAIHDGVTSIGFRAFNGCTSLTEITISDSVTSIGYEAFAHCTGLTSIMIPNSLTNIGGSVFDGWTQSQTIAIEEGTDKSHWSSDWNKFCKANIVGDGSNPSP